MKCIQRSAVIIVNRTVCLQLVYLYTLHSSATHIVNASKVFVDTINPECRPIEVVSSCGARKLRIRCNSNALVDIM